MTNSTSQWGVVRVVTGFAVGSHLLLIFSKEFTLPYYRGRCSAATEMREGGGRRRSSLGSTTAMHQICSWNIPGATWGGCTRCWKVRLSASGLGDFDANRYPYTTPLGNFDFQDEDIITLTDEVGFPLPPTQENIVRPMQFTPILLDWLLSRCRQFANLSPAIRIIQTMFSFVSRGKTMFYRFEFIYPTDSGHAGQHEESESDEPVEEDGLKECMYPI